MGAFSHVSEQYDAFVKFSHDQVERRLAESAFSCKLLCVSVVCVEPCSTCKGWVHCRVGRAGFVQTWIGIVCNDTVDSGCLAHLVN